MLGPKSVLEMVHRPKSPRKIIEPRVLEKKFAYLQTHIVM